MPSSIGTHPWAANLNVRKEFKITCNFEECDQDPAPHKFNDRNLIRPPDDGRVLTVRECITLNDVVAYRDQTLRSRQTAKNSHDVSSLSDQLGGLTLEKKNFRVIYRFTDIVQINTLAVLEAIHFEIFMPDRPDLRFVIIPMALIPPDTCEGDYFEVYEVYYTPKICKMHVGMAYRVDWTVTKFCMVERQATPIVDYVYVTEKDEGSDDRKAVCNWTSNFIMPRHRRFNQTEDEKTMDVHRIYDASLVDTSSAWVYPVEPPKNREEYAQLVQNVSSTSHFAGTFAQQVFVLSDLEQARIDDRLAQFNEFNKNEKLAELHMIRLFKLGVRFRQLITPPTKENVFVQSLTPNLRLQVYTEVFYLDAVTLHLEEQDVKVNVENIKRETYGKRKNTYICCTQSAELQRVMGSRPAHFWIEATFHGDGGSATEQILDRIDNQIAVLDQEGEGKEHFLVTEEIPKMIKAMYGENVKKDKYFTTGCCEVQKKDGQILKLNPQQTRAMTIYHKIENSGFCILSPPGSGKTTVAAAMAASLVKDKEANRQGCVQMLLAVQNVAVENLAIALKAFDDGTLRSYRLLSKVRTDPNDPTPYDIFEHFVDYKKWMFDASREDLAVMEKFFDVEKEWKLAQTRSMNQKEKNELHMLYTQCLFKAKLVLERYMQPEVILSTVDLALFKLLNVAEQGVRGQFWDVDRIIIDEASLLTESTFYCLIRCFPKASFVLIGDDKQLPPFMFDQKVLGHELAGRAALSVAMHRKNLPIIQLVEVYRAPQQLVEPYNHLSYNGELVSRKKETIRPLLDAGLVVETRPDLLLVDVAKGHQRGSPSPFNELEIEVLVRLLALFPKSTHDDIMIICLYKAQKKRLQRRLGPDYEIMTVDSSQGKEKSIVIVLTTRTEKTTDFFCNQNRCTVAVSRHQRALIILGNNSLLSHELPWSKVLDDFTRVEPAQIPGPKWDPASPKKKPVVTKKVAVKAPVVKKTPVPAKKTPAHAKKSTPAQAKQVEKPFSSPSQLAVKKAKKKIAKAKKAAEKAQATQQAENNVQAPAQAQKNPSVNVPQKKPSTPAKNTPQKPAKAHSKKQAGAGSALKKDLAHADPLFYRWPDRNSPARNAQNVATPPKQQVSTPSSVQRNSAASSAAATKSPKTPKQSKLARASVLSLDSKHIWNGDGEAPQSVLDWVAQKLPKNVRMPAPPQSPKTPSNQPKQKPASAPPSTTKESNGVVVIGVGEGKKEKNSRKNETSQQREERRKRSKANKAAQAKKNSSVPKK